MPPPPPEPPPIEFVDKQAPICTCAGNRTMAYHSWFSHDPKQSGNDRYDVIRYDRGVATEGEVGTRQDYFTNKVCSVGKSCAPRDVTQRNPLRPPAWGFKMRYFPNIYGDFSALTRALLAVAYLRGGDIGTCPPPPWAPKAPS